MSAPVLDLVEKTPEPAAVATPAPARRNLVGMSRAEIGQVFRDLGEPEKALRMRAAQVWHWLYNRGVRNIDDMTTIGKAMREKLAAVAEIARPEVAREQISEDGTRKWLLRFADGQEAECVYIPEEDRGTLCVSSQIGCTLTCKFCHTGTQKLVRNLTAAEIVGQVLLARDALGEWPTPTNEARLVSNIVMMGMGEPLYNYENVAAALKIVMDGDGIAISKRRVTLSTAGVVPLIEKVGAELEVNLAISLHAVRDELRDQIVPINRKHNIAELIEACRAYPRLSNARRITFEYVMLKGVNDTPDDARALVRLIQGIPAKVNLIPFNAWPGAPYECSTDAAIEAFAGIVNDAGYASPVRQPRGRDIMAACGQLKSASEKVRRSKILQPAA